VKNPLHIIKKPLLTEKNTHHSSEFNRHSFLVDRRARKDEIKAAVEELYNVRVESVATQNRKGRIRRTRFGYVREPIIKTATVKLHPDDTIELF
jgi:large subunit ribosomal protein L23